MSETRGSYPDTYVESVEWQRDKAYARAEKAERERDEVLNDPGYNAVLKAKIDAEARAEKLAAALENIADKDFDCQDSGCGLPVPVCRDIAARALAENNNNEGGKK